MTLEQAQLLVSVWMNQKSISKRGTELRDAVKMVIADLKKQNRELQDEILEIDRNLQGGG